MNKYILSIAVLLSVPVTFIVADSDATHVHSSMPAYKDFSLKTHLTQTPVNYEKWELADHYGLTLVNYEYIGSQVAESAGTQEWFFKGPGPGSYQIQFKRSNEIKTVMIQMYHDFCGTPRIATGDNPITIIF